MFTRNKRIAIGILSFCVVVAALLKTRTLILVAGQADLEHAFETTLANFELASNSLELYREPSRYLTVATAHFLQQRSAIMSVLSCDPCSDIFVAENVKVMDLCIRDYSLLAAEVRATIRLSGERYRSESQDEAPIPITHGLAPIEFRSTYSLLRTNEGWLIDDTSDYSNMIFGSADPLGLERWWQERGCSTHSR